MLGPYRIREDDFLIVVEEVDETVVVEARDDDERAITELASLHFVHDLAS